MSSMSHLSGPDYRNSRYDRLDLEPESQSVKNPSKLGGDSGHHRDTIPHIGPLYEVLDIYRHYADTFFELWGIDKRMVRTLGQISGITFAPKWYEKGWGELNFIDKAGGVYMLFLHILFYFYYPAHWNAWSIFNIMANLLGWTWVVLDD